MARQPSRLNKDDIEMKREIASANHLETLAPPADLAVFLNDSLISRHLAAIIGRQPRLSRNEMKNGGALRAAIRRRAGSARQLR